MKNKILAHVIRFLILALILVGLFFGLKYVVSKNEAVVYEPPLPPVECVKPSLRDMDESLELSGYIEAEDFIPVVPFVNGTVEEYFISEGDYVEKDQLIALVDNRPYTLQRAQANAQYTALESSYQRIKNLYEKGAATKQELEMLEAQRDAAAAQLELADLQLSYSEVKAPVSGTVLQAPSAKGSVAGVGHPLAVISDLDNLVVKISIPEKYYSTMKDGMESLRVTVMNPSTMQETEATVISVADFIDPVSKNFKLTVKLDTNEANFTPGMYVSVSIVYEEHPDVLVLPKKVQKMDGAIYKYDPETGRALYWDYEPELDDGEWFSVPAEEADSLFIVKGQNLVFDGQSVKLLGGDEE